ncbi:hypothetical protein [Streptomyces sp900116325]|uniref:hypothetical protein n=1 Tax=Streptomyces sp. 900116325 TaxID=3154295 RepID=UPI0033B546A4
MTKLPDNDTLRRFFHEGLSDKKIAQTYGCSVQAVNARFTQMGLERKPYSNVATAILGAAWPREEFDRSKFTRFNRARDLSTFMRWRLGDPTLTENQLLRANAFMKYLERRNVVLTLDWSKDNPWVYMPREPADGRVVIRWPEGQELPRGPHLEAISLPSAPVGSEIAMELNA